MSDSLSASQTPPSNLANLSHVETLQELRDLPEEHRNFILHQMRNAVPVKQIIKKLRERQIEVGKKVSFQRFFRAEAKKRRLRKYKAAAVDADAILAMQPKAIERMDQALVAALKQETFRLLVQEELDAARVKQFFELFLKEKTSALAQAKHEADRQAKLEAALDAFAEHLEDDAHAEARQHYAALRAAVLEQRDAAPQHPVAADVPGGGQSNATFTQPPTTLEAA